MKTIALGLALVLCACAGTQSKESASTAPDCREVAGQLNPKKECPHHKDGKCDCGHHEDGKSCEGH